MTYNFTLHNGSPLVTIEALESNGINSQSTPRQVMDVRFDVGSNAFLINDDVTTRFVAGFMFDVVQGVYQGSYEVLTNSTYDGTTRYTTIPVTTPITPSPSTIVGVEAGVGGIWVIEGVANGSVVYYPGASFDVVGTGAGDGTYTVASSETSGSYPIIAVDTNTNVWTLVGDVTSFFSGGTTFKVLGANPAAGTYTVISATLNGGNTEVAVVESIPLTATTGGLATPFPAVTRITVTTSIPLGSGSTGTATVPPSVAYTFSSPPTMLTNVSGDSYTIIWHVVGNFEDRFTPGAVVVIKDNDTFNHKTMTVVSAANNGANTDVTVAFKHPTMPSMPDNSGSLTHPLPPAPYGFVQYNVPAVASSLKLVGRGVPAYNDVTTWGHAIQENDIHLAENFRTDDGIPPPAPLTGQQWYDQLNTSLQLFASTKYTVVGVDVGTKTWSISGNHALEATLAPGKQIAVYNDTAEPQTFVYTVDTINDNGGNTDIVVLESITHSPIGDGVLYSMDDWHGVVVEGLPVQGDINMNGFKITSVGDPTDPQDAMTLSYANTNYVNVSGDTMTGDLDMDGNYITDVALPVNGTDVANKSYVDSLTSGLVWIEPLQEPNLFDDTLGGPDTGTAADITDPFTAYHRAFIVKPSSYAVTAVNTGTNTWTITGNHASKFTAGDTITISNNTGGANGQLEIVSATNNGGNTDVVVTTATPSATNDGTMFHARGAWNGLDGHVVVYDPNTSTWISVLTNGLGNPRPVQAGDRFGVFMVPDNDDPLTTLPGGSFVDDAGRIYIAGSVSTPDYTVTWTTYDPLEPEAVSVVGADSPHFGLSYTFRGTFVTAGNFGTDYKWIQFVGPSMIVDGVGLRYNGNILNVSVGSGLDLSGDDIIVDETYLDAIYMRQDTSPDLLAIEALASTGLISRTGSNTWAQRSIDTTSSARITITNGNGVSGNPTVDLATLADNGSGSFVKISRDTYGRVSGTTAVLGADITASLGYTPVSKAGDTMSLGADLTFDGGEVLGLPATPSTSDAAASKAYVDSLDGGLQTMWIPASQLVTRTTAGAAVGSVEMPTNFIMVNTFDFDQATTEQAQFTVSFPKTWNLGRVTAEFFWTAASGSGTVIWGIQGVAISDDDPINTTFGSAQTVTDTLLAVDDLHRSPTTNPITIGGTPAQGDVVVFQVYRNAPGDTLATDAKLLGVKLFYTVTSWDHT